MFFPVFPIFYFSVFAAGRIIVLLFVIPESNCHHRSERWRQVYFFMLYFSSLQKSFCTLAIFYFGLAVGVRTAAISAAAASDAACLCSIFHSLFTFWFCVGNFTKFLKHVLDSWMQEVISAVLAATFGVVVILVLHFSVLFNGCLVFQCCYKQVLQPRRYGFTFSIAPHCQLRSSRFSLLPLPFIGPFSFFVCSQRSGLL